MWEVKNRTKFQAAGAFERDKDGLESWCVAVRATFDIGPAGDLAIASQQPEVRLAPAYFDADNRELLGEQDIVAFAVATDVLVRGTVKVRAAETECLPLRLTVGPIKKQARLFGPRMAKRGLLGWKVEQQQPVGDTALRWHNSYGGTLSQPEIWHPANPLGRGLELRRTAKTPRGDLVALPMLEAADRDLLDDPDRAHPVGFGPIARNWEPRVALAGTYDAAWESKRAPLLPKDFDPLFYSTAPADQQVAGFLKGGEKVLLEGFFADGPVGFRLPQVVLLAQSLIRHRPVETRFNLVRVEFDLDARQLQMVWTSAVPCNGDDAGLQSTIVRLKQISGVAL